MRHITHIVAVVAVVVVAVVVVVVVVVRDRYEWRRCSDIEKEALLGHFSLMGERMGIKGMHRWKTWDDADAFQREYEVRFLRGGGGGWYFFCVIYAVPGRC